MALQSKKAAHSAKRASIDAEAPEADAPTLPLNISGPVVNLVCSDPVPVVEVRRKLGRPPKNLRKKRLLRVTTLLSDDSNKRKVGRPLKSLAVPSSMLEPSLISETVPPANLQGDSSGIVKVTRPQRHQFPTEWLLAPMLENKVPPPSFFHPTPPSYFSFFFAFHFDCLYIPSRLSSFSLSPSPFPSKYIRMKLYIILTTANTLIPIYFLKSHALRFRK